MKIKYLIIICFTILFGFVISRIFNNIIYKDISLRTNCYFLVNNDKQKLNNNSIKYYIDNNNFKYLAVTSNMKNADKLKLVYDSLGIKTSIMESYINNDEFINNLKEYDTLIEKVKKKSDLISISEVVLSSYEEMVLEN